MGPSPLRSCTTPLRWPPASAACSVTTLRSSASMSWRPTFWRHGARSSSDPAAASLRTPRPTTCAPWPLAWFPTSCVRGRRERLVERIREAGTHLGTGFLATPYLLPVLADTGHLDVAYELLLQDTPPSWLAMVDRGATTVWESWEGIDEDGRPHDSLNHYSKGAVISFLHNYTAGITASRRPPGLPPLPGRAPARRGDHLGRGRTRLALRADRVFLASRRDRGFA